MPPLSPSEGPVALTGATGFIGHVLLERLLAAEVPVRALHRERAPQARGPLAPVPGDLRDARALRRLVAGVRCIIHCAGAVRGRDRAAFDAVNVAGSQALQSACELYAPDARIVVISSLAARVPHLSDYAASKRAAETVCLNGTPPVTILRPTAVYGSGDRELRPLFELMARGLAFHPAVPDARVTLVHVDDMANAVLACASQATPTGRCYEVCDTRCAGYTWHELAATMAQVVGRGVRPVGVSPRLARAIGRVNLRLADLRGRAPMLTPGKVAELYHADWRCDLKPIQAATGWTPRIDLATGFAECIGR